VRARPPRRLPRRRGRMPESRRLWFEIVHGRRRAGPEGDIYAWLVVTRYLSFLRYWGGNPGLPGLRAPTRCMLAGREGFSRFSEPYVLLSTKVRRIYKNVQWPVHLPRAATRADRSYCVGVVTCVSGHSRRRCSCASRARVYSHIAHRIAPLLRAPAGGR
jgi:hypothetical protein